MENQTEISLIFILEPEPEHLVTHHKGGMKILSVSLPNLNVQHMTTGVSCSAKRTMHHFFLFLIPGRQHFTSQCGFQRNHKEAFAFLSRETQDGRDIR